MVDGLFVSPCAVLCRSVTASESVRRRMSVVGVFSVRDLTACDIVSERVTIVSRAA